MRESKITKSIAEAMIKGTGFSHAMSKSGASILFNEDYISSKYAAQFSINEDRDKFEKAFRIVTEGVGNEISKINSVTSSSLLSLLFFFKLFENNSDDLDVRVPGINLTFKKAFFEVRNNVVVFPSCIDIVLVGEDGSLLFLESKFTEFIDYRSSSESYGISYLNLYNQMQEIFSAGDLKVKEDKAKTVLYTEDGEKYIDGIKQSISHLIGLVKGPQEVVNGVYDEKYLNSYKEAFFNAPKLFYGSILFNPNNLNPDADVYFTEYKSLYEKVIGNNGDAIVKEIAIWCDKHEYPNIEVLKHPLTYQTLLANNDQYKETLPEKVKKFYNFS